MNISTENLKRALSLREQIDTLTAELDSVLTGPSSNSGLKRRGRPPMSADTRAKIAAAQTRRWAKQSGKKPATPAKAKGRRTMSAASRAKIAAAAKARWAKVKAGNGKTLAGV